MSDWVDLLRPEPGTPRIYEGEIATAVSDVDEEVMVIIPAFHRERTWGPAPWMPRVNDAGATVYPAEGDRCCVVLAESIEPGTPEIWILGWWTN
jgi:hypothetical protein